MLGNKYPSIVISAINALHKMPDIITEKKKTMDLTHGFS
jgi:hypothetical protein